MSTPTSRGISDTFPHHHDNSRGPRPIRPQQRNTFTPGQSYPPQSSTQHHMNRNDYNPDPLISRDHIDSKNNPNIQQNIPSDHFGAIYYATSHDNDDIHHTSSSVPPAASLPSAKMATSQPQPRQQQPQHSSLSHPNSTPPLSSMQSSQPSSSSSPPPPPPTSSLPQDGVSGTQGQEEEEAETPLFLIRDAITTYINDLHAKEALIHKNPTILTNKRDVELLLCQYILDQTDYIDKQYDMLNQERLHMIHDGQQLHQYCTKLNNQVKQLRHDKLYYEQMAKSSQQTTEQLILANKQLQHKLNEAQSHIATLTADSISNAGGQASYKPPSFVASSIPPPPPSSSNNNNNRTKQQQQQQQQSSSSRQQQQHNSQSSSPSSLQSTAALQETIDNLNQEIYGMQTNINILTEELDDSKNTIKSLNNDISVLENTIEQQNNDISTLHANVAYLQQKTTQQISQAKITHNKHEKAYINLKVENISLHENNKKLHVQILELLENNIQSKRTIEQLEYDKTNIQHQYNKLLQDYTHMTSSSSTSTSSTSTSATLDFLNLDGVNIPSMLSSSISPPSSSSSSAYPTHRQSTNPDLQQQLQSALTLSHQRLQHNKQLEDMISRLQSELRLVRCERDIYKQQHSGGARAEIVSLQERIVTLEDLVNTFKSSLVQQTQLCRDLEDTYAAKLVVYEDLLHEYQWRYINRVNDNNSTNQDDNNNNNNHESSSSSSSSTSTSLENYITQARSQTEQYRDKYYEYISKLKEGDITIQQLLYAITLLREKHSTIEQLYHDNIKELEHLKQQRHDDEIRVYDALLTCSHHEQQYTILKNDNTDKQDYIEKLINENKLLHDDIDTLHNNINNLQEQITIIQNNDHIYIEKISSLEKENKELHEISIQYNELKDKYNILNNKCIILENDIENKQNTITTHVTTTSQLEQSLRSLQVQYDNIQRKVHTAESKATFLDDKYKQVQNRNTALEESISRLKNKIGQLISDKQQLYAQFNQHGLAWNGSSNAGGGSSNSSSNSNDDSTMSLSNRNNNHNTSTNTIHDTSTYDITGIHNSTLGSNSTHGGYNDVTIRLSAEGQMLFEPTIQLGQATPRKNTNNTTSSATSSLSAATQQQPVSDMISTVEYNRLEDAFIRLQNDYNSAQSHIHELDTQITTMRQYMVDYREKANKKLHDTIDKYKTQLSALQPLENKIYALEQLLKTQNNDISNKKDILLSITTLCDDTRIIFRTINTYLHNIYQLLGIPNITEYIGIEQRDTYHNTFIQLKNVLQTIKNNITTISSMVAKTTTTTTTTTTTVPTTVPPTTAAPTTTAIPSSGGVASNTVSGSLLSSTTPPVHTSNQATTSTSTKTMQA